MIKRIILSVLIGGVIVINQVNAGETQKKKEQKSALVLAMFGTSVEAALKSLINIRNRMIKKYPNTPVKIAFTSNIIRKIWDKRSKDPAYVKAHPEIPKEILDVQTPLATVANLQDNGYDNIVVQPTLIAPAEEYLDLCACMNALNDIKTIKAKFKPFNKIVVGRPALGTFGTAYSYQKDIEAVAKTLVADAKLAEKQQAALVYMGHGNNHFPSSGPYLEFQAAMRRLYPNVLTIVGTVEGFPKFNDVLKSLKHSNIKKVVLKPLMVVAGDHAKNDMAGKDEDSWQPLLEKEGIEVKTVISGLGENDKFADIFIQHTGDAAKDADIKLK